MQDGIDPRGAGVGHQQHVALIDGLKSANAAAVEPDTLDEHAFIQLVGGRGEVLPGADHVGEPEIHHLHPLPAAEVNHL